MKNILGVTQIISTKNLTSSKYLGADNGEYEISHPEGNVFICISLGLPYRDNNCYKFVSSIIGV
jgi:hypothetical protein